VLDAGSDMVADSAYAAGGTTELTLTAGIQPDSSFGADGNVLFCVASDMEATAGFSSPGFDKTHRELPVPRPPQPRPQPTLRVVPPPPAAPKLSISMNPTRRTPR